ncbi:hypothetical protein O181_021560 [Austropuccinia psidii MF-1]|uniref:Integrase catalytic domain-containing protein n=1 Tax=Austropuccinia psidii MF-1 TaxID=1389203 RepID=A0A9Q3CFX6_9BASI|nr:hypothetical protein [Austropuccinia psidii MF-1]
MDLPPSSYHASPEEETEEIETMVNVFPSAYNKYLDVFSKVKAEKLPPNGACDHHIELEGSLPPVGVIYSLSSQESDTLRDYISENLEKVLIWPSSSSTGAPLLFVKKEGWWPLCKLLPEELNYEIHEKELLGIVWALKRRRAFLLYLSSSFEVLTNHSSLQYFMKSKILTFCQARWAEFLSEFHFSITYLPGRLATLPDALLCQDNIYPERGEALISKNPMNSQKIIKQDEIQASKLFAVKVDSFSNLIDSIQKSLWQDCQYRSILQYLSKGKYVQDYSLDSSSQLLLFKDWVVVPNDPKIQLSILQKRHDSTLSGNPGQEKTLKLVKWDFYWSGMTQFIKYYVSSCQQCSRNENIHHKKFGLLKSLPIPNDPWICLSMYFITQLPLYNSFDSMLVIVERLSKMAIFIPTMSSVTSLYLAHLFIKNIFSKNGLPSSIVSDRDSLFVSSFWNNLFQKLKILRDLSTAYHQETDGQTERVNQILQQYFWMYVSYNQDDWNTWLPPAEFSYNNSDHSSTKQSPFFTVYEKDPQFDSAHITQDTPAGKLSTKI